VGLSDVVVARQIGQGTLWSSESTESVNGAELTVVTKEGQQKGDADGYPAHHQYEKRCRHHFFSPPRLVRLGKKLVAYPK